MPDNDPSKTESDPTLEPSRRRNCLCELCTVTSPRIDRIRKALPAELIKDFDYLMMRMMCAEEDRDVVNAQLYGDWPGWEWMKEARKQAEKIQPPA